MTVGKLTTCKRDYTFVIQKNTLDGMIEESKRNFVKYALSDSEDGGSDEKGDDFSEKSQE
jgi:hypothetical protein